MQNFKMLGYDASKYRLSIDFDDKKIRGENRNEFTTENIWYLDIKRALKK